MPENRDLLISIHPKHAQSILAGEKSVELRRRPIRAPRGSRLWIYSTLPEGKIVGTATIDNVTAGTPEEIWEKFSTFSGVDAAEYNSYFDGSGQAFAISLEQVRKIASPLSLASIRAEVAAFHPPQFVKHLSNESQLMTLLSGSDLIAPSAIA